MLGDDELVDALISVPRLSHRALASEQVDLSRMAGEIIRRLQEAEPGRMVDIAIAPDQVVAGDRAQLKIMLEQLLANAWKFSAGKAPARIAFDKEMIADQAVYAVSDNGVGFDMAYANKLFQIFQRLHLESAFSGIGIGLAMAQRIVRNHGGEIWGEGVVDQGATFRFTLGAGRPQNPDLGEPKIYAP